MQGEIYHGLFPLYRRGQTYEVSFAETGLTRKQPGLYMGVVFLMKGR